MQPRREQRITRAGVGHIVLTGLLGLGAINSQNNLLYLVFGIAAGAILVSGIISGSMLLGLRVEREALEPAQAGEAWTVRYRVRNTSRWLPAFAILIGEEVGEPKDGFPHPVRTWSACLPRPLAFLAHVSPRADGSAHAVVIPTRRGVAGFSSLRAESSFPFGLFRKSVVFTGETMTVVVRPPVRPLREPVRRVARRGHHDAPASGDLPGMSDDFYGVREYAPGDSLRRVAWRRSARTGVLAVRETAAPAPERLWVVLDLAPAQHEADEARSEGAIALTASVVASAERDGLEVGLVLPSADGAARVRPGTGPQHLAAVLDALGVIDTRSIRALESIDADPNAATLVIGGASGAPMPSWAVRWNADEAEARYAPQASGAAP